MCGGARGGSLADTGNELLRLHDSPSGAVRNKETTSESPLIKGFTPASVSQAVKSLSAGSV